MTKTHEMKQFYKYIKNYNRISMILNNSDG